MADFLASFNFGAADDEPFREESCASLEEVQARFRDAFEDKVTDMRAEHIKTSVEVGPTTQFTIFVGQGDNIDPSLSRVSGRDALVSQPQSNPTMQIAVSQEILNAIGNVDGSTWSKTEEKRKTQGWVFTYVCNHSWQQWTAHGKATQTHAILDYSQKALDFNSRARPAFDCRGSLTITFSKTNSAISVNYSHTPFHRTVGEIYDMYKPQPRPQTTNPNKKAAGSAKKSANPRQKRPATDESGEPIPKKRRKKPNTGAKNQLSRAELLPMTEGEIASADGAVTVTPNDAPDHVALAALQAATAADSMGGIASTLAPAEAPKNNTASLNVSPEEATRRRELATKKLTEAGINPATLSADQFSIFSNQSPEIQTESLKMLVKYGAERLHIVHPAKKDSPRPLPSRPDAQTTVTGAPDPQLLGSETGSGQPRAETQPEIPKNGSSKKDKAKVGTKSRVFCFNCRLSKSKCSKDKPSCTVCRESGLTCEYPARKPRPSKSAAIVTEEDDTMMDAEGDADDTGHQAPPPSDYHSASHGQVSIANMMQITPDDQDNGSRPIGDASLPAAPTTTQADTSTLNWSSGGLALPQGRVYYPANTSAPAREPVQTNTTPVADIGQARGPQPLTGRSSAQSKQTPVPLPAQARLASPRRERHESPLERHNPMRREVPQRNTLQFDKPQAPNPYSQTATQPQQRSDPYSKNPTYGQHHGPYPQLEDTAPERVAYDPNSYKSTHSRAYSRQQPHAMASLSNARRTSGHHQQEAAAADALQRFQGYGDSHNQGVNMLPVHLPGQRRATGRTNDATQGMIGVGKHGTSTPYSAQPGAQQGTSAQNKEQNPQASWYGFNGLHGNSASTTHQNQHWGGSGNAGWS